jgi:hypothetical protein
MKRRSFLKKSVVAAGAASVAIPAMAEQAHDILYKSILELRVYHMAFGGNRNILEQYLKEALIPLASRYSVKVGVFTEYSLEDPAKIYALFAYPSPEVYVNLAEAMLTNQTYINASKSYTEQPATTPIYSRFETFLLEPFDKFPGLVQPSEKKGLYELRVYESATEGAGTRKITMFNKEEIDLFLKVGLQPVFFGRIMAGPLMPALIYMLGFKDMTERDALWGKFGAHEDWKVMSAKPEYANTVSNIHKIFLIPTEYSQI